MSLKVANKGLGITGSGLGSWISKPVNGSQLPGYLELSFWASSLQA